MPGERKCAQKIDDAAIVFHARAQKPLFPRDSIRDFIYRHAAHPPPRAMSARLMNAKAFV